MKKTMLYILPVILLLTTGCTLFKGAMDKKTGFSTELITLEGCLTDEQWQQAGESYSRCVSKWKSVKPWMQLEIDHDIVNDVDIRLAELSAYVETGDKPGALANIRVIIQTWENIGSK